MDLMCSPPFGKCLQDMRWVTVDLREATIDVSCIKVRGMYIVGVQLARRFQTKINKALPLGGKVSHQIGTVVIALLSGLIHVSVNRWRLIMLRNELNHRVAKISKGI